MISNSVITVSQLNCYIKSLFDSDEILQNVFVRGEISNFTDHYSSGHFYLSLKDGTGCIKAIMFSNAARRVKFKPQDGMSIIARGRVSVYESTGQYQLYIDDMQPDGIGALNLAYEQLKSKLEAEGMFDADKKKSIPKIPKTVGVITSPTGAVIRDIENVLSRRFPYAKIIFCPVKVQGEDAASQMVDALRRFNAIDAADVIIIGRGGGSIEELWPFNDEELAREIFKSSIPIISAVGHETDFTICDFVADLRAPTPSAAAELAVPDASELLDTIHSNILSMSFNINQKINTNKLRVENALRSKPFRFPMDMINERKLNLDYDVKELESSFFNRLSEGKMKFSILNEKLNILNPMNILSRGYSIVHDSNCNVINSVKNVKEGQDIKVRLQNGDLDCIVKSKRCLNNEEKNII